jgi:hypothetical protein
LVTLGHQFFVSPVRSNVEQQIILDIKTLKKIRDADKYKEKSLITFCKK